MLQAAWSSEIAYSKTGARGAYKLDARAPDGSVWQLTKSDAAGKGDFFMNGRRFCSMTAVIKVHPFLPALVLPNPPPQPPPSQYCEDREPPLVVAEVDSPCLLEQSDCIAARLQAVRGAAEIAVESRQAELAYEFSQSHTGVDDVGVWREQRDTYVEDRVATFRSEVEVHGVIHELKEAQKAARMANRRLAEAVRAANDRLETVASFRKLTS